MRLSRARFDCAIRSGALRNSAISGLRPAAAHLQGLAQEVEIRAELSLVLIAAASTSETSIGTELMHGKSAASEPPIVTSPGRVVHANN